ncbi:MAG: fibronectin type III domain-containing protein [Acidobacteriota bacterium]
MQQGARLETMRRATPGGWRFAGLMVVGWLGATAVAAEIPPPATLFAADFETGNLCAFTTVHPADGQLCFPGIVFANATGTDTLQVAWQAVTATSTPPDEVTYEVHLAEGTTVDPTPATLYRNVLGELQTTLSGLSAGVTYSVVAIAVDGEGRRSSERDVWTVRTAIDGAILDPDTPLAVADDLGLGTATVVEGALHYPVTADGHPPAVGSVLITPTTTGGVVRAVDAVETVADTWVVQTGPASVSDAVPVGSLNARTRLIAADANARTPARQSWPGGLLTIEETAPIGHWNGGRVEAGPTPGSRRLILAEPDAERGGVPPVEIDIELDFEPELTTDLRWGFDLADGVRLHNGLIVASGTLEAEIGASFEFADAGSWEQEIPFPLLRRTYTQVYIAPGPIPVYQQIELSVRAVVSAQASAAIDAGARASATVFGEVGVTYVPTESRWRRVGSLRVDPSITAELNAQGSVEVEVRLIPEITIEFYEALSATLSVEPSVVGTIAAETFLYADLIEDDYQIRTEPTEFTFRYEGECSLSAALDVLVRDIPILEPLEVCTFGEWLFSLPLVWSERSIPRPNAPVIGESITFTARTADGIANPADTTSIEWRVDPESATVDLDAAGPGTLRVTPTEHGIHTVIVSGHGLLGDSARQFYPETFDVRHGYFAGQFTATGTGVFGNCRITTTRDLDIEVHLTSHGGSIDVTGVRRDVRRAIDPEGSPCRSSTNNESSSWGLIRSGETYRTTFGEIPPIWSLELIDGGVVGNHTWDLGSVVISGDFTAEVIAPPSVPEDE